RATSRGHNPCYLIVANFQWSACQPATRTHQCRFRCRVSIEIENPVIEVFPEAAYESYLEVVLASLIHE
ncbi:MAG TPA: hypothetical protein VMT64_05155, partial [Candidatus Binataceae bacterium]|nr:hypothetical protein [Candidatus Binataceae bacterium]